MKKVLLASTAVAAFIAFSSAAQAQDPGRADYGATEGGGGAGSAFTITTSGAVKFYLKYATGSDASALGKAQATLDEATAALASLAEGATQEEVDIAEVRRDNARGTKANDGLFTLITGELEINGAATTDSGIDIETHVDFSFGGNNDSTSFATIGGSEQSLSPARNVVVDELSLKISGGFGSVELGRNDGAEDTFKIYAGTVGAGTGGTDGDEHTVSGGVDYAGQGGQAGSGDSGDNLKVTYLSPVFVGIQGGVSLAYQTADASDTDGGTLGVGLGVEYSGSAGGVDYAASLVWGDANIASDGTAAYRKEVAEAGANDSDVDTDDSTAVAKNAIAVSDAGDAAAKSGHDYNGYGGLGIGVKVGGAGASFATGVTIDNLGKDSKNGVPINWSGGIAYAIGDAANVSFTSAAQFRDDGGYEATSYLAVLSGDYAVLPGVTLALDLGYGDSDVATETTDSAGFTGLLRVKAAF